MVQPLNFQRIDPWEMRRIFNQNNYWERVQSGELSAVVLESRNAPASAGQPPGTLSQSISYRDPDGNEIARVHQYLMTDGTLSAGGRPDPKRLFYNGVLYRLVKGGQEPPPAPAEGIPEDADNQA
jgi:hypothetical protein